MGRDSGIAEPVHTDGGVDRSGKRGTRIIGHLGSASQRQPDHVHAEFLGHPNEDCSQANWLRAWLAIAWKAHYFLTTWHRFNFVLLDRDEIDEAIVFPPLFSVKIPVNASG
jgi:hypothetical protein